LYPEKIGVLPEIMMPNSITLADKKLYVVEGATIFVYSIKNLKMLRTFGKRGEGPGELRVSPTYLNKVRVYSDHVMVEGVNKLIFFSTDGKLIREIRKKQGILQTIPVGKNYAVNKLRIDDKTVYNGVSLFNSEMEEIKELYSIPHIQQGQLPSAKIDMLLDYPSFRVYENKIFVEKSTEGFIIDVFDEQGKKLYQINKDYEKIKISQKFKTEISEKFKEDPLIKNIGWDTIKRGVELTLPDIFPAIQSIEISANKIYIQTYKTSINNYEEYIIMDLKGSILKRTYLPKFKNVTLIGSILGTKLHVLKNDQLIYLWENEESEQWELFIEEIK
jgi:hypothetical protein